jgi:C-terminal domain on Strawberry notch homologue
VLISTDVPGEKRFTATVASRLSALGAISKGDRATGNNGLFDQETNDITSKYAKTALSQFFDDLNRERIQGMSIDDFQQQTGLRLLSEGRTLLSDLPPIHTFLNRILALPIYSQNLVFAEFEQRIRHRIAQAQESGTYDRGLETICSEYGFEIAESKVLHTQGNAETICHTIDKLTKPRLLRSEVAQGLISQGYKCYRHRKQLKLAIAAVVDSRTKMTGDVVDVVRVRYPVLDAQSADFRSIDRDDFTGWDELSPDANFWQEWDRTVEAVPEFVRKRFYLISGLLLPVWDKLPADSPKICRLQANDGRVLLGRSIDKGSIVPVLNKFGIDTSELLDAPTIFDLVWHERQKQTCGKWKLQVSYFKGEERLEILAVHERADLDWLRSIGCFTEMLNCQMRVFIPIGQAVEIIALLLK